uniref:Uncharacterized protein n=1 Tax=Timema genevievae TaxID=629358 RepID=A0A7R9K3R1_TIMGE|nr:unnamed protein product [Timema genevievae]
MTPSIRKERFKRSHEELHPIVDAEILVNDIGNIHEPKYFLSGVDNNFGFSSSIAKNDKEYIKKHMGPRLKSDEHEEEEYKEPLFLARNEPLKIERKESVAKPGLSSWSSSRTSGRSADGTMTPDNHNKQSDSVENSKAR